MTTRVHTGGLKEFRYLSNEVYEDTESTRAFKEDLRQRRANKYSRHEYFRRDKPNYRKKRHWPIYLFIFLIILGATYYFNYKSNNKNISENFADAVSTEGKVVDKLSLEKYFHNAEEYDGQYLTIPGYLIKDRAEYLTDNSDNRIKLVSLRPPQILLFPNEGKSEKLYGVRGILNKEGSALVMEVRDIEEVREDVPEQPKVVSETPVSEESTSYFELIKNKLITLKEISLLNKKETTVTQEYSASDEMKLPAFCFIDVVINLEKCKCSENYTKKGTSCVRACKDGTVYGDCSEKDHLFCKNGELFEYPEKCGCQEGFSFWKDECISQEKYVLLKTEADRIAEEEKERLRYEQEKQAALNAAKAGLTYINQMRAMNGRSSISFDERVFNTGMARVKDMYDYNYMDHTNPVTGSCADSIKSEYGLSSVEYVAENAYGMWGAPATPRDAIDSWMTSRGHRYNLLYEGHTAGAVACYGGYCVFLGLNRDGFGNGCSTGAEGMAFWDSVGQQPGEI